MTRLSERDRGQSQAARDWAKPWFPLPWRVEEDWTAGIIAANGRVVAKMPYTQNLAEAHEIVRAVNAGSDVVAGVVLSAREGVGSTREREREREREEGGMSEPSERDLGLAKLLIVDAMEDCGVYHTSLKREITIALATARAEGEAKGRREAIEECARILETMSETIRNYQKPERYLSPKRHGDLTNRAFIEHLRALAESPAAEEKP